MPTVPPSLNNKKENKQHCLANWFMIRFNTFKANGT